MRDPKRIATMIAKLAHLWYMFPDMRFWQLIQMLDIPKEKEGTDPFYWEDDVWDSIFQKTIDKYEKK